MNLNYAIFRSEPIMTTMDLAQIGSHNKREKKAYQSNKDIKIELSKNNIELVPLNVKYVIKTIISNIISQNSKFINRFYYNYYHPFFLFKSTCVPLCIIP